MSPFLFSSGVDEDCLTSGLWPPPLMEGGGGQPRGDEELLKVSMLLLSRAVSAVHSYPYAASRPSAGEGSMRRLLRWETPL